MYTSMLYLKFKQVNINIQATFYYNYTINYIGHITFLHTNCLTSLILCAPPGQEFCVGLLVLLLRDLIGLAAHIIRRVHFRILGSTYHRHEVKDLSFMVSSR